MKLTAKEVELLSKIDAYRRTRRRNALMALGAIFAAWIGFWYFDRLSDSFAAVFLVVGLISFVNLIRAHTEISAEDKLINLLRRYIDRDVDAICQISSAREPEIDETAA